MTNMQRHFKNASNYSSETQTFSVLPHLFTFSVLTCITILGFKAVGQSIFLPKNLWVICMLKLYIGITSKFVFANNTLKIFHAWILELQIWLKRISMVVRNLTHYSNCNTQLLSPTPLVLMVHRKWYSQENEAKFTPWNLFWKKEIGKQPSKSKVWEGRNIYHDTLQK